MLELEHLDDAKVDDVKRHMWHFVYLHGKAEDMFAEAFIDGGNAPDLCMANVPLAKYFPCDERGLPIREEPHNFTVVPLACTIGGKPGVVVLSNSYERGFNGRAALIEDVEAMRHIYSPQDWC